MRRKTGTVPILKGRLEYEGGYLFYRSSTAVRTQNMEHMIGEKLLCDRTLQRVWTEAGI